MISAVNSGLYIQGSICPVFLTFCMGNLHKYFTPIVQMVLVSARSPGLLFHSVSGLISVFR